MIITSIKSMWPEKRGFGLERNNTGDEYIFLHFLSPVDLWSNKEYTRVEQGGCIIFDKFSYQKFSSDDCNLTHNWFHLTGDLSPLAKKYSIEFDKIYYPENDARITSIVQNMEIEFMNRKPHWEDICALGCEEIFAVMTRGKQKSESSASLQKNRALIDLRTAVHLAYNMEISVEEMAKEVGMSVSRFYAEYSAFFGVSPGKDLINTRIEHAKRMLASGMEISSVAENTGFKSTYHFIRQFKKYCAITPGQYQKLSK